MNTLLFRFINQTLQNPLFDSVLPVFSDKDYVVIPGAVALGLLAYFGRRHARTCVVALALAVLLANLGSEKILKNLFKAKRPYAVIQGVHLHRGNQWRSYDPRWYDYDPRKSYAFPSTHAANVAALAVALAFLSRKTLWATLPLALLVGLSRVYTGNHFPGDVLAGYLWGALCGFAVGKLSFWGARRICPHGPDQRPAEPFPRERKAFLWILALWTLVNFAFVHLGRFDLAGDEAQYWDWSRRLALGYYSKPPLIAYLMAILTSAGGHKEWAIRSGAVLFSSGTLAIIYALTLRIARARTNTPNHAKAERTALVAACVALAMPSTWVGSVLMTIDPPTVFFWALAMYLFHRAVNGESAYWVWTGLALGVGLLAKYTGALLVVSFALYLILLDRRHWRTLGPYAALVLMLLCLSGVIYWNAANDWVSIRHPLHAGLEDSPSVAATLAHLLEYLAGQIGVASPIVLGLFFWAMLVLARRFRRDRDAAYLFLCFIVLFAFYFAVACTRKPLANWPVAAYLAAAPAFACVWTERPRGPWLRRLLAAGVVLGCALGILARSTDLLYFAAKPFTGPDHRPDRIHLAGLAIDPDKDPTNHLRGGKELGAALSEHLAPGGSPFIFSNRYQLTAWAAFYTRGRPQTYCLDPDDKRRFNQYDLWGGWDDLIGRDALFVTGGDDLKAAYFIYRMKQTGAFEDGKLLEKIEVRRGNTVVRTFTISKMHNYSGSLRGPTQDRY